MNETLDGERGTNVVVNGHVKWQKALMQGLQEARAKAWQRAARKADTDRVKEMAGEWILYEPPHITLHTTLLLESRNAAAIRTRGEPSHRAEHCK